MRISQQTVRELFDYNHSTGDLIRKRQVNGTEGMTRCVAGNLATNGYLRVGIKGKSYLNHRLVWLWHYGYFPEHGIDHINRDTTDNRLENLREVSQSCNMRNTKLRSNNTSGVKGVYFVRSAGKWAVKITVGGRTFSVGRHASFVEAVAHRLAAEQCHGWQGCDRYSPAYIFIKKTVSEGNNEL